MLSNGSRNENRRALVRVFVKKEGEKKSERSGLISLFFNAVSPRPMKFFFFFASEKNSTERETRDGPVSEETYAESGQFAFALWSSYPVPRCLTGSRLAFEKIFRSYTASTVRPSIVYLIESPPRRDFHDYDFPFSRERRRIVRFVGKTARSAIR